MKKRTNKNPEWKQFENYIAQLYTEIGCPDVSTDINIDGNQIDVFTNIPNFDGTFIRTIVSCKHYASKVGVADVREWYSVFRALFDVGNADLGVIVSEKGFTQDAQALAKKVGIKLVTVENLRRAAVDFRPYLKALIDRFSAEPVFSRDCYIPMKVQFDGEKKVVPIDEAIDYFLDDTTPQRLFLLLGDYGAGKTTVCKFFFQSFAKQFLNNREPTILPIFISLRDYPGHLNLESMVTHLLINEYQSRCSGFAAIQRLLEEGRVIIFLDAFDEMASRTDYQITLRNFHEIRKLLVGKAKIILTCRTHYFKDTEELQKTTAETDLYRLSVNNRYRIAYLQGFTPEEIKKYVRSVCQDKWEYYYDFIENTYNLKAIAERPILLDMITEVLPELVKQKQDITSTRLYQLYTRFWLARDDWRTSLSANEREDFTIAFAEAMYRIKKEKFSWIEVETAISHRWPKTTRKEIEHYKYDIRSCSFITRDPKTDEYEFIHESFVEFFVSSFLYQSILKDNPEPFILMRHTPEILSFLVQYEPTEQVKTILSGWVQNIRNVNLVANCLNVLTRWMKKLYKYSFKDVRIDSIEIRNVSFSDCTFEETQFHNCRMFNCKIADCTFQKAKFNKCDLFTDEINKTIFDHCTIRDSRICISQTDSAEFLAGQLLNCDLSKSRLKGICFRNTILSNCTWSSRCLNGAVFDRVTFDLSDSSIRKAISRAKSYKWSKPPVFRYVSGFDEETVRFLTKKGVKFAV